MLSDTPSSDTHPHFLRGNGDKAHIHVPAKAASQEDRWLSVLLSFFLFIPEADSSVAPIPMWPLALFAWCGGVNWIPSITPRQRCDILFGDLFPWLTLHTFSYSAPVTRTFAG